MKKFAYVITISFLISGCSGFGKKLKGFLSGDKPSTNPSQTKPNSRVSTFSENPDLPPQGVPRQYRRVTRDSFEKEGLLETNAGSLWVGEGQASYLFAQNTSRLPGDFVNILMEGAPKSQISQKVDVIRKLLERNKRAERSIASKPTSQTPAQSVNQPTNQQNQPTNQQAANTDPNAQTPAQNTNTAQANQEDDEKFESFNVENIPARIVEQMPDGTYRVKGHQSFMIGKREYRVIATGLVRAGDFQNDTIPAGKVLDPQFDIVAIKKETRQ